MKRLASGRRDIALHELQRGDGHELQRGDGPTLLALHALGGDAGDFRWATTRWPGRVWSLDFSGHGASGWNRGGSYTAELFAADADAALAAPCAEAALECLLSR